MLIFFSLFAKSRYRFQLLALLIICVALFHVLVGGSGGGIGGDGGGVNGGSGTDGGGGGVVWY